jgi:hypothetical protein
MQINTPQTMNQYVGAVMHRARHHGGNVIDVIAILKLLVVEYGTDIEISDRANGKIGNVSWFKSKAWNKPYYFRYSHDNGGSIELLHTNCNGRLVARFTNQSTASEMVAVFDNL